MVEILEFAAKLDRSTGNLDLASEACLTVALSGLECSCRQPDGLELCLNDAREVINYDLCSAKGDGKGGLVP